MPFLTHSWMAAAETVAPSVETTTRSTSKKGRSKITSPFLFTKRRSLFFPTETPKPSTNTSLTTLPTGPAPLLFATDYAARGGHNRTGWRSSADFSRIPGRGFLEEGEEG